MKCVIFLGDGMADEPIESLGGKTPIAYAETPNLDTLSKKTEIGMVHTIPDGMSPGSDTANLSVIGYDPKIYYSGRFRYGKPFRNRIRPQDLLLRPFTTGSTEYRCSHERYGCGTSL